jgi:general secretion pathway protein C
MNRAKAMKRIGRKIPIEIEMRIVELSYQNPEFGAKRLLPLLKREEIDVSLSSIYRILKRHGLQTRILRIAKIEERCLVKAPSQDDEISQADIIPVPLSVAKTEAVVETLDKRSPSTLYFRDIVTAEKPSRGRHSFLLILNLSLFLLIGYLGFHAVQNLQTVTMKSDNRASNQPSPIIAAVQPQRTPRPLSDYRGIWQRNLFNIQKEKASFPNQNVTINDIVVAKTDLGLKLLGTVVTNNNPKGFAIIKNLKTAEQGIYHEEDKVEEAYVKKILRNKVIISIDNGDQLLTVGLEDFAKSPRAAPRSRTKPIRIDREEVESALADVDGLMGQLRIAQYRRKDQPIGFRISGIPRNNVLRKLGLRSRDVIKGVNGQVITSPDQAEDFFKTLSAASELTIKLNRSRKDRLIHLNIK